MSPDGRHEWVEGEWRPVPPPPQSRVDRLHSSFQVFAVVLAVVIVLWLLAMAFEG